MEMKKLKRSSEPRDRLSELHDSLILNVFEILTMKDIVKTQILSRRWEKLWTLTPYLYFDNNFDNLDKFRKFVNSYLLSWRGKRIQKFKVRSHKFDKSMFSDMDLWLRFAVDNGVEELETCFNVLCFDFAEDDYVVPKCLYSYPSLQKLSIVGSMTNINGNVVQWNQLKILKILFIWITQDAIDVIFSGIPVLEDFTLGFNTVKHKSNLSLSFRSTSLKKLCVSKVRQNVSMDTGLRIWTPNLETLTISGGAYVECVLMNVPSLTHATLSYEDLRLSKVIGATTSSGVLSPLSSIVYLNLNGSFEGHEQIVEFLEFFPKLKTLVLGENIDFKSKKNLLRKFSLSFLMELRTVQVTWNMCDSIFPLIATLLKYARKLEKIVFRVKPTVPSDSLLLASTRLLRMRRSSPTAELIFLIMWNND